MTGVRLGWTSDPCCLGLNKTITPCLVGGCAVQTRESNLPASPFLAEIAQGRCRCFAPQVCG